MHEEKVLFKGSPSLLTKAGSMFVLFVILAGFAAAGFLVNPLFHIGAGVIALVIFIQILLVKARSYEVTNERIRLRTGIMTKRTDELELYRVKDATLVEPLALRMWGLGNIDISTLDASTPSINIEAVRGAPALREQMRQAIEECRDRKRVRLTEFDQAPGA